MQGTPARWRRAFINVTRSGSFPNFARNMDREKLDKWCERGILGLVLAILVYAPLALGAVRASEFLVVQTLTCLALALWIGRVWVSHRPAVLWAPACWAILGFLAYVLIRYQSADIEYPARQETIRILIYAALFFIVLNNLNRQESVQFLAFALIAVAAFISAYAIYQFATNSNKVWHFVRPMNYDKRGSGSFINPNHLAGFLEMVLPLCLSYTLIGRFSHATKIVFGYAAIIILVGIGVSLSRGGWLVTALLLPIFLSVLLFQRDFRLRALVALVLLLTVGLTVAIKLRAENTRVQELVASGNMEEARFYFWRPAIKMWQDHFWLGVGPAHFDYRYREYRAPSWIAQVKPEYVHNDYLNTLADYGTLGTALILSAWILFYLGVFKTWPFVQRAPNDLETKTSNKSSFVLGASMGLVGILLHSVVDFNMHIPANAIVAVTLMALVTGHLRFATERYWISLQVIGKGFVSALSAGMIVYLAMQGIQRKHEAYWLARVGSPTSIAPQRLAALKHAFQADPKNGNTVYAIGETLRLMSWQGDPGFASLATEAMDWFRRAIQLNRFDVLSYLRLGMCLDWIDRRQEANTYFERATQLDPNGYYVAAFRGWHAVQLEDYAGAKQWFDRSLEIFDNTTNRNRMPAMYLEILRTKTEASDGKNAR